jgi:uncharacterized membrane-anchored protein
MHYKLHLLVNRLNPFRLLHKLPFQKRKYEELGIDIDKEVDSAFSNRNFGLSILVSGGVLLATLFLLIFILFQFITKLLDVEVILNTYIFAVFGGLAFGVCYLFVFRKDKYLTYFDKFDSWTKQQQQLNIIISSFFIVITSCLFFASLFN